MKLQSLMALVTFLFLNSNHLFAEESTFGVGVDAGRYSGYTVSFPMNSGNLFIEPTVAVSSYTSSGKSTNSDTDEREDYDLGIGIFGKQKVTDKTFAYFGARFGFLKRIDDYESSLIINKNETTGFYMAPTFGAEYYLVKKFSLGIDVGFQYANIEIDNSSTDKNTNIKTQNNRDEIIYSTVTRLMIRYYF